MDESRYTHMPDGEERRILCRLDDLSEAAARGCAAVSAYLTPREARWAMRHLHTRITAGTALLWGGYPAAERVRAILLPDYVEGMMDPDALAAAPEAVLRDAGFDDLADTVSDAVAALTICGSGFRSLSHRDYLGSILGLGVERDAIGDLLVIDGETDARPAAILMTDARMAVFLADNLERVATDTVRIERTDLRSVKIPARKLAPIRDTVASERLDCVVAALCNLSREAAQTAIRQGLCEVDYESVTACDLALRPPATVTVRGHGKFLVEAFDGETRKGRIRLLAGKYI